MSPSESELRAALHEGEGERPDADAVIARARAARHQRRVRIGAAAASALAVAGIAAGSAVAFHGGGSAGTPAAQGSTATPAEPTGATPSGAWLGPATYGCPKTVPHPSTPPAGADTSGSLFPRPVHSVQVCAYVSGAHSPADTAARLTGRDADELVASINRAPLQQPAYKCASARYSTAYLVIIGVDAKGTPMPPVTASVAPNPCNRWITNGSTTRYGWQPPDSLAPLLPQRSSPPPVTRLTPPPTLNRGSPPR